MPSQTTLELSRFGHVAQKAAFLNGKDGSMSDLAELETVLREIEEDIRETTEEIDKQRYVVRQVEDPFERRYAEHVLSTHEHQRSETLVQHEQIAREIAERKLISGG
jgi:predicted  nucleic acid-binding Zn-ribbon protein